MTELHGSGGHVVRTNVEADYAAPSGWAAGAPGYRRWTLVDETAGAVHTGFGLCELAPDGAVPAHVHSFEESFYVVEGTGAVDTPEGSFAVGPGDYGFFPVGVSHQWRNLSGERVRWAEMQGPVPRSRYGDDTVVVPALSTGDLRPVDVRDPRTRRFGNITAGHMDVGKQSQEMLAVSASMRTALLVYSGITVKMMVDSDLGAQLTTMFMVQYAPDGVAGKHDHPFEETYYFLEGRCRGVLRRRDLRARSRRRRLGGRRVRAQLPEPRRRTVAVVGDAGAAAAGPPLVPFRPRLGVPRGGPS